MINSFNKSKISYEKYLHMKSKLLVKSYSEKFNWIDKFLYIFSWFGNAVSIFLAFFFLQTIFYASFKDVSDSIIVIFGIIFFLTLFELLKRYVIGLFSVEVIKNNLKIFKKGMGTYIISVLFLLSGSFYLTLSGAKDFIDNTKTFTSETKTYVSSKVDSISNIYNFKIETFNTENVNLRNINTSLRTKLSETTMEATALRNGYQRNIDKNTEIIKSNQDKIDQIENEKKAEIESLKSTEEANLNTILSNNKSNIIAFIIISTLIELIIVIGIYYHKFYDFKTIEEYEKTVIETTNFKTWLIYNNILEIIYSYSKGVGQKIPTTDDILDMCKINNISISKTEFDRFIKILYTLDVLYLDGKRRILNKSEEDGFILLKNHFKIL